jgi:hypothetical protein
MSDNWMYLLPLDPFATPSPERIKSAEAIMGELRPGAGELEIHLDPAPAFYDAGANFETVFCPHCEAEIMDWWYEAMERWDKGGRRVLDIATPCCGKPSTLNDLDYVAPQGFASFAIEAMNPGGDLEPEELERLSAALGLKLRVVWQHI